LSDTEAEAPRVPLERLIEHLEVRGFSAMRSLDAGEVRSLVREVIMIRGRVPHEASAHMRLLLDMTRRSSCYEFDDEDQASVRWAIERLRGKPL